MKLRMEDSRAVKWTTRDIAKLLGILLVLSVVIDIAVPTAAYNLGISFESDLYRILSFTVVVVVFSVAIFWTISRRWKASPIYALPLAAVVAVVITTGIFLFILG